MAMPPVARTVREGAAARPGSRERTALLERSGFAGANCVALDDADIERAATKIEDEQGLGSVGSEIGAEGIGIGGGDGFVGEVDALEARQEGGLQHARLGKGILFLILGIAHRPAEHHLA